jgi:tol-pal system protein YbgF
LALDFQTMWTAPRIDIYPDLAMQTLLRAGLFFLIFVAFSPAGGAQCPEGTRNNYKGECVSFTPKQEDAQTEQEEVQKWSEPDTESGAVEAVAPEDGVEEEVEGSSAESVVIVEEMVPASEDDSTSAAVQDPLPDSSGTTDLANALSTIQQLREEIKDLLNRVELQRYEVEKLRGRQRDLYDDLDQRLRKQERLVLTVPVPAMPSVDSIVITPEADSPAEPTPMVTGAEQPSQSTGLGTEGGTESVVMSKAPDQETLVVTVAAETVVAVPAPTPMVTGAEQPSQSTGLGTEGGTESVVMSKAPDQETLVVTVAAETVVAVPAPTPMVVGTDLPVPSVDSGAVVIAQPQIQVEMQEGEALMEPVAVEQMSEEAVSQVTTVVVELSETEVSENAVEIEAPTPLDPQENQLDVVQNSNARDEIAFVVPPDTQAEEQSTVAVTAMAPTTVTLGEQDAYDQAFNMLKQSRYDEAAEEFANFLRQYRNSQLTDDAWYWMAEAHYVTRDFERALIGFNTVVSYFVNSPRIPASHLKIGYIQYETADYEGSRKTLTQLLRDFPAHRVAVSAEARLKKMDRERH